jgi:hypothetical protein
VNDDGAAIRIEQVGEIETLRIENRIGRTVGIRQQNGQISQMIFVAIVAELNEPGSAARWARLWTIRRPCYGWPQWKLLLA